MPDVNFFEQHDISVEEVRRQLDEKQSVEATADHYGISARTVSRFIKGKLERRFCWYPTMTTIDIKAGGSAKDDPTSQARSRR